MTKNRPSTVADLSRQIAGHQARLQVIGANWGENITEKLDASEKELLRRLQKQLRNLEYAPNTAESVRQLKKITAALAAVRLNAYGRAEGELAEAAAGLIENEGKWAKKITGMLSGKTGLRNISAVATARIVANGLLGGRTVSQWFTHLSAAEAARIEEAISQGVASGWTIGQMKRVIAGSAENDYRDGILQTSRREAENMARTITNGIANAAKDAFYQANPDAVIGVEILSTLDGRTCPVCASLDRKRYRMDEPHPALPLHHNCRCVLLPVTPASDFADEQRPMANADFNAEAKRNYEKKYPGKNYDDLAAGTRKKYYYQAMREFERRTGKPAYVLSNGAVSFQDYFRSHMTEQQRKDWLGPERYKLWKKGNLSLDKFFRPYPDRRMTVAELKRLDQQSFVA